MNRLYAEIKLVHDCLMIISEDNIFYIYCIHVLLLYVSPDGDYFCSVLKNFFLLLSFHCHLLLPASFFIFQDDFVCFRRFKI